MAAASHISQALFKAAQDTDIPDVSHDSCWLALKIFLKGQDVDITTRSEAEWKKLFKGYRRLLNKELGGDDKEKGGVGDASTVRSTSMVRQRQSETLPDSAYESESPQDHVCSLPHSLFDSNLTRCAQLEQQALTPYPLNVLVEPCPEHPQGRVPVTGCFSDDTDEDYIIDTIYDRLKIPKGKDGKVSIPYIPLKSTTTRRSKFSVREDKLGQADMVFTRKRPAPKDNPSQSQSHIGMSILRPLRH